MKKLIVGLGNPGEDYKNTRHNTGSLFIDYLTGKCKVEKKGKLKNSHFYKLDNGDILLKSDTFMNNSGIAVKEAVKWFDTDIEKYLILVHDDLDLPLGKYKCQFAKSPRDHKGVKSVEDHLGTNKFHRVRIGIDNRGEKRIDGDKYVLTRFKTDEIMLIHEVFTDVLTKI